MTLKDLNLTEVDFDMIVDGLEHLPNKGAMGEMMGEMLRAIVSKSDDPEKQREFRESQEREMREREEKRKIERQTQSENIKILQGKLLMLKRYLKENDLMDQVNTVLNS